LVRIWESKATVVANSLFQRVRDIRRHVWRVFPAYLNSIMTRRKVMKRNVVVSVAVTLGLVSLSAYAFQSGSLTGELVPLSAATRTIQIEAKTEYVNVTEHETVEFQANGHAFAISFAGGSPVFDLNQLAPSGALDHKVKVYVAPDLRYLS
jgi:hypothetical protein